jgi:hypothetical protein
MWHYRNSYGYTKILGKFSCRVTSKILGIGSAERSWGDVKHLKTNKRAHLSASRVKKQATIFGASCMERSDIERSFITETKNPYKFWTDEDFNLEFDMLVENAPPRRNIRIFLNWKEDWEDEAVYKKDAVSEAKLLHKYGGLQWYDLDTRQTFYSDPTNIMWTRVGKSRKGERTGGYCIIAYDEGYDKDNETTKESHTEHWTASDDLRWSISTYYREHPELNVQVQELEPPVVQEPNISQLSEEEQSDGEN